MARRVPQVERSPEALTELFERDRAVHSYGLADLEEPFWSQGRWFRRGDAAVGVLDLEGAEVAIVYCVSARANDETLALLVDLAESGALPAHSFLTGPLGVAAALEPWFSVRWCAPHTRMWLADLGALRAAGPEPVDSGIRPLDAASLPAVERLFVEAPDSSRFFTPSMLDSGHYVGRFDAHRLVAMAGVHVVSERFRVAAIGNVVTHPDHRGRGHGTDLVRAVCRGLAPTIDVISLNVSEENVVARRLYDRLGFESVIPFDEGEFVAR
jgi:ribosomal protein S18 acetylase RimI-like enzyme